MRISVSRRLRMTAPLVLAGALILGACGVSDTSPPATIVTGGVLAPTETPTGIGTPTVSPATSAPLTPTAVANVLAATDPTTTPSSYLPVVVQASAWTQLGANPQRTSFMDTEIPTPWRFKWIWNGPPAGQDGGAAAGHLLLPQGVQPVVGDGKLYVGHSDGIVRAILESNGVQAWASNVGGQILNTAAFDPATRYVFVTSTNGRLFRLRSSDGAALGSFDAGSSIVSAPLLVGSTVFIATTGGKVHAVDVTTLTSRWTYDAGAELRASPSYSAQFNGLIIVASEDKHVHAIQAQGGGRRWRVPVNADQDPIRGNKSFSDTFPVVSDANGVVIVRSYFDWQKTWTPTGGAPSSVSAIRDFLAANPTYQSFHVLNLDDGQKRFVAPVMGGAIGNNDDYYSGPPQAVVKTLDDGSQVAYLLWRNRQACLISSCDGREDTTLGELNLSTGNIRFVDSHRNEGSMRLPTDEQGALSMAGNTILHAHWMVMGGVRITDRSSGLGGSFGNPIRSVEIAPIGNTLGSGQCSQRNPTNHTCPVGYTPPGDGWQIDPGFYIYYSSQKVYDSYWAPPVRGAIISGGVIYWRSSDGAIIALQSR